MYNHYDHRNQGTQNSNYQHSIQLSQKKKKSITSAGNNLSTPVNLRKKFRSFKINIMDQRRIELENNRLLKRIGQINTRRNKNKLSLLYNAEDDYISLNKRSREACRVMKQKQIQMQNDNFVHRLVTRLHSYKSVVDNEEERKNSHSKSRSKKKYSSFILPPIIRK